MEVVAIYSRGWGISVQSVSMALVLYAIHDCWVQSVASFLCSVIVHCWHLNVATSRRHTESD